MELNYKVRKVVTLQQVRQRLLNAGWDDPAWIKDSDNGICALVSVTNMGWCKDGETRWYHFDLDGVPCVLYKR